MMLSPPAEAFALLVVGMTFAVFGVSNVVRRRPSLWNRGWPVFYGVGSLLFAAAFSLAGLYQFSQLVPE